MTICSIPFSGFYESSHDAALDQALESMCSDENGELIQSRHDIAWQAIDWRKAHLAYAQEYASALASECDATWTFGKLDSPREYNFRSDEIDVSIEPDELQRMYDATDKTELAAMVAKRLKRRDGFMPFYSDDLDDWGALDTWEPAQLSILVECYCDQYCDAESRDWSLVDDCSDIIESAIPADKLALVYDD